jgi:tRNA-splicing ligase RtcB (3'-phosphate/5'-hydroxy nucleic acid ligase)
MIDGAAVLFPSERASRTGFSVNHGSGRIMGRSEAKRELAHIAEDIDHEMRTISRTLGGVAITGIAANTEKTPLDECGHVYKALDDVLDVLVQEDIATIARRLFPVANIKGTD